MYEIVGEAVGSRESVHPAMMQVGQTLRATHPQTAIDAAQKVGGIELPSNSRKCVSLNFPAHKPAQPSAERTHQEPTAVISDQRAGVIHTSGKRVALRGTRSPSPEPGFGQDPQIVFVVFVQCAYAVTEPPGSVALHFAALGSAQVAGLRSSCPDPYGALTVLNQRSYVRLADH